MTEEVVNEVDVEVTAQDKDEAENEAEDVQNLAECAVDEMYEWTEYENPILKLNEMLLYIRDNFSKGKVDRNDVMLSLIYFHNVLAVETFSLYDLCATEIAKLLIALQKLYPNITEFHEEIVEWKKAIYEMYRDPSTERVA